MCLLAGWATNLTNPCVSAADADSAAGLDAPLHRSQSTDSAARGPTPPWHTHPSLSALNVHQSDASHVDTPADAFGGYVSVDDTLPADTSLSDIGASASDLGASASDLGASASDLAASAGDLGASGGDLDVLVTTESEVVTLPGGEQYVVTSNLVDIETATTSLDADYEEIYAKYKQPAYLAELLDLEFEEYEKRLSEYVAPDQDSGYSQEHLGVSTSGDITATTQTSPEVVSSNCNAASGDASMSVSMEYSHSNSAPHSNLAYGDNSRQNYPYYQQDIDMYSGNFSNNSSSGYMTYSVESGQVGPEYGGQRATDSSGRDYMDYTYTQSSHREVRNHRGNGAGGDDDEIEALYRQELRTHYQMVIKGEVSPDSEIFKQLANGRAASPQQVKNKRIENVVEPEISSAAVPMGGLGGSSDSIPRRFEEIEREVRHSPGQPTQNRYSEPTVEPMFSSAAVPMGGLGGSSDSLPRRLEEIEREVRQSLHGNREPVDDASRLEDMERQLEDMERQMRLEAQGGHNQRWDQDRRRDIERDLVNKMDQSYSRRDQDRPPAHYTQPTSSLARPLNLGLAPDPYPNRVDKPAIRESLWERHDQKKETPRLPGDGDPSGTKYITTYNRAPGDGHPTKNTTEPHTTPSPYTSIVQQRPKSAPLEAPLSRPKSAPDSPVHRHRDRPGSPDSLHSWRGVPRNIDLRNRDFAVSECSERSSRIDSQTYQSYAAGILHSTRKSDRFQNLQRHYSTMERIAELESHSLDKTKSLGNLKDEAALLSKYKLENLGELHDLYAELEEAQREEEFFYKSSHVDSDDPWKDWGILAKELSLQELKDIYRNKKPNMNTNRPSRRRRRVDFRRDLSFRKLREKYKHLDEASRKEKIMEEWWSGRPRSRRNSDASSVQSFASQSQQGEYIQIMENAARKSKERAMYGYNIDEEHVRYEMYVENLRKKSKSCPDVSDEGLHVRSESEPRAAGLSSHRFDSPQRADSYKISRFNGRDPDHVDGRTDHPRDYTRRNARDLDRYQQNPGNENRNSGSHLNSGPQNSSEPRWKQNKQSVGLTPSRASLSSSSHKPEGKSPWESDSPGSSSGIGSMSGEIRSNSSPREYASDRPVASSAKGRPWENKVSGRGAPDGDRRNGPSGLDSHEQWRQERRGDTRDSWRDHEDSGRGRESGKEYMGGRERPGGSWRDKESQGRDNSSRDRNSGPDRWKSNDTSSRQREPTLFEGREADTQDFQNSRRRPNGYKEAYMEKRNWRKDSKPVPGAVNAAKSIFENQQSSSGQTTPSPSSSLPDMLAPNSGYGRNGQSNQLRSSSVPPNDPKHKKVTRNKSYIDPDAYQSIKSRFLAPDPPPRAPKSALPNITPRTPLGRYEARIRDKESDGDTAMSKSKSMPSDLHAGRDRRSSPPRGGPDRPWASERGRHREDMQDRDHRMEDRFRNNRPLPMGDHRTQPSRVQAVEPLVVDTGNGPTRNFDRPPSFAGSQNSLQDKQALRNITDEMKRTRPEFHKPAEESGSLLRPLERSNIQANISSERVDSLSLQARASRLDSASPWDPKEGSPSWHTKGPDRTFALTGRDSFERGSRRSSDQDRNRAKSLDREQFRGSNFKSDSTRPKSNNMSYVTSALAHSSRTSPGKDAMSRSPRGHGAMEKWDSQESNDTLIIKGSDNDLSQPPEDRGRTITFGNSLDRSKSEPNLKEQPRLIDDHSSIVSSTEDKPKNFNEIRAQFESGYSSDNPDESPKQFSSIRRTISGDLKEIRKKYEDNSAAFSQNAWEKEQLSTPRSSLTGKTPPIVRPAPIRQTASNDPRRDDHTLYEQPWDLRNRDIIRAPSPQSVSRATRDFALNLDMIDREWKTERQKQHYRQQKEGSVTGSERPDSAASWTGRSTLTKSNPELAGGSNKWERQVHAPPNPG